MQHSGSSRRSFPETCDSRASERMRRMTRINTPRTIALAMLTAVLVGSPLVGSPLVGSRLLHAQESKWMPQAIDGYIGVLWSANVHVEKQKGGEALWTFHDYPHVEAVERESPAERAGILAGDMILAFNGKDLRAGKIPMNSLLRPGSTVAVRLSREDRTRSVDVTVAPRPRAFVRTPRPPAPMEPPDVEWRIETPEPAEPMLAPGVP